MVVQVFPRCSCSASQSEEPRFLGTREKTKEQQFPAGQANETMVEAINNLQGPCYVIPAHRKPTATHVWCPALCQAPGVHCGGCRGDAISPGVKSLVSGFSQTSVQTPASALGSCVVQSKFISLPGGRRPHLHPSTTINCLSI